MASKRESQLSPSDLHRNQRVGRWDEFSSHSPQSLAETDYMNTGSLEGIHDIMHILLVSTSYSAPCTDTVLIDDQFRAEMVT